MQRAELPSRPRAFLSKEGQFSQILLRSQFGPININILISDKLARERKEEVALWAFGLVASG